MQSVNDDMDELFRRAAEDYPLKTDNTDWNKLFEQLNTTDIPLSKPQRNGRNGYKKFLWLLLFIPACLSIKLLKNTSLDRLTVQNIHLREASPQLAPLDLQLPGSGVSQHMEAASSIGDFEGNHKSVGHSFTSSSVQEKGSLLSPALNEQDQSLLFNNNQINSVTPVDSTGIKTGLQNKIPHEKKEEDHLIPDSLSKLEKHIADTTTLETTQQKKTSSARYAKVYAGIMGALDISTVKTQRADAGYSIGITAGYRFARRWGIETGIYWDKKSYYSDGEYFNAEKLNIPSYSYMNYVDGSCNMWEIPLNVRYNFNSQQKGGWFVTAGMSSYLMNKEEYDYSYTRYSEDYTGHSEYNRSTQNWFSIINISAGYEKRIGKAFSLRIEPYIKIPVNGVGIGNLPISSIGINAGFFRSH